METFPTHTYSPDPIGSMAQQLQKAAVRVLSEQTCRRFYPVQISSRMLCAGFPQGGVDSCSVSGDGFSQYMYVARAGLKARTTTVLSGRDPRSCPVSSPEAAAQAFATPGFLHGFWDLTWVLTLVLQAICRLSLPKSPRGHQTLGTSHFTTACSETTCGFLTLHPIGGSRQGDYRV